MGLRDSGEVALRLRRGINFAALVALSCMLHVPLVRVASADTADDTVVPVQREPRHVTVLENKRIRLLNVVVPVGDTTLYHEHKNDLVVVVIQGSDITNQGWKATPAKATLDTGRVSFVDYSKPGIHRISNVGSRELRLMAIELLGMPTASSSPREGGGSALIDNARVRVRRVALELGQTITAQGPALRVFLTAGTLAGANGRAQPAEQRAGAFQWSDVAGESLRNAGSSRIEWIETELK